MQQNRDRNGRPRNTRPYDLNRDVARTSAPSQDHTPRSTGSSRYGYNGEPLRRPPPPPPPGPPPPGPPPPAATATTASRSAARPPAAPTAVCAPPGQITASSSPPRPNPSPAARRRGRGAIPPSIPPVTARRAADQKTRSPVANSAARQTMPAAGRAAGKTRTRKTARTGSTRQAARAPRSKALPGGKCAKSAR